MQPILQRGQSENLERVFRRWSPPLVLLSKKQIVYAIRVSSHAGPSRHYYEYPLLSAPVHEAGFVS